MLINICSLFLTSIRYARVYVIINVIEADEQRIGNSFTNKYFHGDVRHENPGFCRSYMNSVSITFSISYLYLN